MPRLDADADPARWVPVTESFGFSGRRARKRAIGMLLGQATTAMGGAPRPGGRFAAWAASQAVPALMRRAGGRVRAWMWKAEPELVVVLAQMQELTPQLRTARAMMPMAYDDTEDFRSPYLGTGEKLVMTMPPDPRTPPFVSYTWDTGTHLVTLSAVCSDRERVGTLLDELDHLARSLRVVDDLTVGEGDGDVLRLPPA